AICFFFSSRRRHTRFSRDWSSDVCSSDLRVRVASAGVEGRQASILVAVDDLAYETASAMFGVQRYRQLIAISRDQVRDLKEIERSEERRVGTEWRAPSGTRAWDGSSRSVK